jgi:hypothetical protein
MNMIDGLKQLVLFIKINNNNNVIEFNEYIFRIVVNTLIKNWLSIVILNKMVCKHIHLSIDIQSSSFYFFTGFFPFLPFFLDLSYFTVFSNYSLFFSS